MKIEIQSAEQFAEEIKTGTVVVDFYADWCGPCQMLSPLLDEVIDENPEIKLLKVNVDRVPAPAADYGVYSIPNLVYIKDGEKRNQAVGYMPKKNIERFLEVTK